MNGKKSELNDRLRQEAEAEWKSPSSLSGSEGETENLRQIREAVEKAIQKSRMTLDTAKGLTAACEEKARDIGVPMVITVVDEGGNLTSLHRMDGSLLASLAVSQAKAFTALALRCSTEEAAKTIQPGQPLYGLQETHPGRFCLFGGGIPLFAGEICIGAVGVSGGSVEQDTAVATRGAQWLKEQAAASWQR